MRKALKELQEIIPKEWLWVLEEVHNLIDLLPTDGSQTRSLIEQLRDLLLRLSEDSSRYCTFQSEPLVTWTNNATEQVIGKMKMRAHTVRGYKSWPGMHSGWLLAATPLA